MDLHQQVNDFLQKNSYEEESLTSSPVMTYTLKRNYSHSLFPHKQTAEQAQSILQKTLETLQKTPLLENGFFLDGSSLTPSQREALLSHFLFQEESVEQRPYQGLWISPSEKFIVLINFSDHLILHGLDCKHEGYVFWNELHKIDDYLIGALNCAYTPRFGFLTSSFRDCGTALSIKAYLHLPFTYFLDEHQSKTSNFEEIANEPFKTPSLTCLSNHFSLGFKEEDLLKLLQKKAQELLQKEHRLKNELGAEEKESIKALIGKSVGILKYSYLLTAPEAFELLSHLKLGASFGWIKNLSHKEINYLIFHVENPPVFHDEDKDKARALFLKERLKNLSLDT